MPDVTVGESAAYLAVPVGSPGPWPGVVVIHEAFGLNADIRGHADRLAALGYLAPAPDLNEGRSWLRCIRGMIRQLHAGSGPAFDTLDACRGWLAERPDCTGRTGVIGFCMGGGFALLCAPRGKYAAAAVNYGEVPSDAEAVLAGSCPVVASYGGRDPMGTAHPGRLETTLTALGVPHDVKVYPAAGHSFMSPKPAPMAPLAALARLNYDKEAAEDAWQRIFAFFGRYLRDQTVKLVEETPALHIYGGGNIAGISASLAKSCAQKYVIAASAAGSSSQNETCVQDFGQHRHDQQAPEGPQSGGPIRRLLASPHPYVASAAERQI